MKRSYALTSAALLLIAGGIFMTGRRPSSPVTSKDVPKMKAPAPETQPVSEMAAATPETKPKVFFLDEAGTAAPADRPQANLLPKTNGSARLVNPEAITTPEEGDFMAPRWSPDGLELMFSKAGYSGLYTKGILGGELVQITGKEHIGYGAEWTDDGKIVAKNNKGERQEFNPDGSPASGVDPISDANITGAFNTNDTVYYRANPGEAPVPVSTGEDRYYGGVVSPDGKYIAYNGLETGIYVKPVDGSAPPVHIGEGTNPTFTPDSNALVYSVTQDDGDKLLAGDLYMSSLDGKNISNLTENTAGIALKPSVSPDGQKVAYESNGQIFVATLQ